MSLCARKKYAILNILELNSLPRILDLLLHKNNKIRSGAANILVNITKHEDVREEIIAKSGVLKLLSTLKDSNDVLKPIMLKILINFC